MQKKERKTFAEKIKARIRLYSLKNIHKRSNNRGMFILYQVLTLIVLLILLEQAIRGSYENCFTCALTLILFLIPNFVETKLKITLPQTLEVIIILFVFSAEMLGEIREFYLRFYWWDDMLHTLNGFLMAAIGFSMVDILNKNDIFKFQLSPIYMAVVSFCFSMTAGVLWEFFEFFMDLFYGTDMQKDFVINSISSVTLNPQHINSATKLTGIEKVIMQGTNLALDEVPTGACEYILPTGGYIDIGLIDTMNDLIVNFIGAIIFSIFGFFHIKTRGKGSFIKKFIPKAKKD